MRPSILAGLLTVVSFSATAGANDASASFLTRLFTDVCIPNLGQVEKVRAWAAEKRLTEVTAPAALAVFVGAGDGGVAWAVPTSFGSFALSIRGESHSCAVYARTADPGEVESNFRTILEGVSRPGLVVKTIKDDKSSGPTGTIHTLIYSVSGVGNEGRGFLFILQTAEKNGGAFQASLQAGEYNGGNARTTKRDQPRP